MNPTRERTETKIAVASASQPQQNDPLAKYRRENLNHGSPPLPPIPTGRQEPEENPDGLKPYKAFEIRPKASECLEIWQEWGSTHMIDYRHFQMLTCNNNQGTEIVLQFSFLVVKISGRNLKPVIEAVRDKRCGAIHRFYPEEHIATLPDEPTIENIEFFKQK